MILAFELGNSWPLAALIFPCACQAPIRFGALGQNNIASPLPCQQVLKGLNAFPQITLLDVMMIFWTNAMVPVKFVIGEVVDGTNAMWNLKLKCTVNIINWTRWWI